MNNNTFSHVENQDALVKISLYLQHLNSHINQHKAEKIVILAA